MKEVPSTPPCPGVLLPLCPKVEESPLAVCRPLWPVALWHLTCPTEEKLLRGLGSVACRPHHPLALRAGSLTCSLRPVTLRKHLQLSVWPGLTQGGRAHSHRCQSPVPSGRLCPAGHTLAQCLSLEFIRSLTIAPSLRQPRSGHPAGPGSGTGCPRARAG